jgi:hypothetical protein
VIRGSEVQKYKNFAQCTCSNKGKQNKCESIAEGEAK